MRRYRRPISISTYLRQERYARCRVTDRQRAVSLVELSTRPCLDNGDYLTIEADKPGPVDFMGHRLPADTYFERQAEKMRAVMEILSSCRKNEEPGDAPLRQGGEKDTLQMSFNL